MDYKKIAREIIETFFVVYTVALVINGIILCLNGVEDIPIKLIFDMLLISFITSLPSLVLLSKRELKRREMIFRLFIQFVLILGSGLAVATYFQWVAWSAPATVLSFAIMVLIVYVIVHAVFFFETKKLADKLNEKLKERYKN